MKLFNKFIYIAFILLINTDSYSAGEFKLISVNNQTDSLMRFVYSCLTNPDVITWDDLDSNTTKKYGKKIIKLPKNRIFGFNLIKCKSEDEVLYNKHCWIEVKDGEIKLFNGLRTSDYKLISDEEINESHNYLVNLIIKSDDTIQMQVIQE